MQGHQSHGNLEYGHTPRQVLQRRLIIVIIFLLIAVGTIVITDILSFIHLTWIIIFPIIFSGLSVIFAVLQWLFPINPISRISNHHHKNKGQCPIIDFTTTVWPDLFIQEVYEKLIDANTSVVVMKGLSGFGATTLANLVYRYAEELRLSGNGWFTARAIWLYLNPPITITNLAIDLFTIFKKPLSDLNGLQPQQIAEQIAKLLATSKRRLIVLELRTPLSNGKVLTDHAGFNELFRTLNGQLCNCRVLLTNCPWWSEPIEFVKDCIVEYDVRGVDVVQGIELLRKYRVEGTDEELCSAVQLCGGHVGAFPLLVNLLRDHDISLSTFINNDDFIQEWMQAIASRYFTSIFDGLDTIERQLLFAFSIYRKPVPIQAAEAIIKSKVQQKNLRKSLHKLISHNLFLPSDLKDRYQLQLVIANYARHHFAGGGNRNILMTLQEAHVNAAHYYEEAAKHHTGLHTKNGEFQIEAIWHLLKAKKEREAYHLVEKEKLLKYLAEFNDT